MGISKKYGSRSMEACSETRQHTWCPDWTPISQSKRPPPTLAPEYEAYLRSADFRVALTLIPYDGYRVEEAKRAAEQIGRPFIEVAPIGLQFWDLNHLIAESRDLASERVVERWSAAEGR